jgi:Helix-turn-helix domain
LRRRRLAAGLSLRELATRVHYSKGHLSRIETGAKAPGADLAHRCDTVLGAGGRLAALVPPAGATPPPSDTGRLDGDWYLVFAGDGRTEFGTSSGADPSAMATGTRMTMTPPPPVPEPGALSYYRAVFDALRALGQQVAPAELVPSLVALTRSLQSRTGEPEMLLLASRFAEFTGWMAQEGGDDRAAVRWTDHAVRLASAAGDERLSVYRYVRHADIALYRHDALETVALARRAQAGSAEPRIRFLATQREAQGYAIAGDDAACRRALDRAAHHMATATDDGTPTLGTSTLADPLDMTTGWCLHDLGRSTEAVEILATQVGRIPVQARRARARYGARLALALASVRELEESCAVLTPILETLPGIDSATIRVDLRQIARTLNRWRTEATVRAILPEISTALRTRVTG